MAVLVDVYRRIRLTRRGFSLLIKTFINQYVVLGNSVCVDGELRENHRQKLWLVCKNEGEMFTKETLNPKIRLTNETNSV